VARSSLPLEGGVPVNVGTPPLGGRERLMKLLAINRALRHIAGWGMILFFMGLLTLIFSFLGSFFCAGLAGMMVGSVKFSRPRTIVLSFLAPLVLCSILVLGHTQIPHRQVVLLSGLSFGIFWFTYLIFRGVGWYERKSRQATPDLHTGPSSVLNREETLQKPQGSNPAPIPTARAVVEQWGLLSLHLLQGKWSCAGANGKAMSEQKVMEIEDERVLLTVSDAAGNISFHGKGQVSLSTHQGNMRLTIANSILDGSADTLVSI
jgi:hypothetical protein